MWRNFRCLHITDVEKSEILHIWHVCDIESVAIYAKFMHFFATIYVLSCGEKLSPKVHCGEKMTNIRSALGPDKSLFQGPVFYMNNVHED